jgi:hypothetical protein
VEDLDLGILCGDDLDEILQFRVYDQEKSGKHEPMGNFETSINGLVAAKNSGFQLKLKGKVTGDIIVHAAEVSGVGGAPPAPPPSAPEIPIAAMNQVTISPSAPAIPSAAPVPVSSGRPSFADYVAGGCELSMIAAIDFTGSNGDPRQPGTLHHFYKDGTKNDYQKAISAIGGILQNYDQDKKFPVLGFGAKYGGVVRHCFQCGPTQEVDGIEGILNAYKQTFSSGLVMSGPTVITEVIQTAAARAMSLQEAASQEGKQNYTVLLILTDGAVSDVAATAQAINAVSHAPLSIVIVGIGQADFSGMQFIDDNNGALDIVQFVPFNAHKHNSVSLTEATLDEIPHQLESYFLRHNIMPNPPVVLQEEEIVVQPEEEEIDVTIDFGSDGNVSGVGGGTYVPPGAY